MTELPDKFLTRGEIASIPPMRPMIGRVLDKGTVAMLVAPPASGKTFLALDLACCYATEKPWQNHPVDNTLTFPDEPPLKAAAGYVVAEGLGGFRQRLDAWESAWQTRVPDDRLLAWRGAVHLADAADREALRAAVYRRNIGLLVIDTLARCSVGLEENSASDMGRMINAAYHVRDAMGPDGTVLLVHHAGKAGGIRGSSALEAGVDQVLKIRRDGQYLELSDHKRKDSPEMPPIRLQMKAHGESVVLESGTGVAGAPLARQLVAEWGTAFSTVGSCTKTELRTVSKLNDRDFLIALNEAISEGWIQVSNDRNPRYRVSPGAKRPGLTC